ncbi:MAG: antibiotic biosynthesis monooxygenase [Sphingomonadales bacterium]|nr:antibiotic biosynthesis monooxygenase [Sphingomonadales bacterium]
MVTEIAAITVAQGNEAAFERAMRDEGGLAALAECPGVISVRFGRGVESPDRFGFVVEWESVEAHAAAKDTESFGRFRAAIGPWGIGGEMQHYDLR